MHKKDIQKKPFKFNLRKTIFFSFIITLTVLSLFNFSKYIFSKPKITYAKNDGFEQKIYFWQNFLTYHPTYFEGWIELTKLQIRSGLKNEAEVSFLKAWKINPNSSEINSLEEELQN